MRTDNLIPDLSLIVFIYERNEMIMLLFPIFLDCINHYMYMNRTDSIFWSCNENGSILALNHAVPPTMNSLAQIITCVFAKLHSLY